MFSSHTTSTTHGYTTSLINSIGFSLQALPQLVPVKDSMMNKIELIIGTLAFSRIQLCTLCMYLHRFPNIHYRTMMMENLDECIMGLATQQLRIRRSYQVMSPDLCFADGILYLSLMGSRNKFCDITLRILYRTHETDRAD